MKRSNIRETLYTKKELNIGFKLILLKNSHDRKSLLLTASKPKAHLEARDDKSGAASDLDFHFDQDFGLTLHRGERREIPALLNGKRIGNEESFSLSNGSILQIGEETIKIRAVQVQLGAQGPATRRVYSSDRRGSSRKSTLSTQQAFQGLLLLTIALSMIFIKTIS